MKGVVILSIFLLVGAVFGTTEHEYKYAFAGWMHDHSKMYTSEEFLGRFEIFKSNMDYVNEWNARNTETVLGLNYLADLTNAEYQSIYLGTHIDGTERLASPSPFEMPTTPLADTIDWRTQGVVTDIKDQGQCGSCWAFSATGSIEAAHDLAAKELVSLSEQNLMDCSTPQGNQGCNGGLMDSAFKYVISNKGIDTEASYPYQTRQGACRFSSANIGATITSFKDIQAGNETALLVAVNIQPVSVAIDASHNSFQLYKSGVYIEAACSASRLDHGVLAVGYGSDESLKVDYWIVKNSWGKGWGMNGYINMLRNKNNQCGIATAASYPIV